MNRLRPEKFEQRNLIKLTLDSKLNFKMNYLKRSESKPTLCGVFLCGHSTVLWSNFFTPELEQVESNTLPTLQVLTAYQTHLYFHQPYKSTGDGAGELVQDDMPEIKMNFREIKTKYLKIKIDKA